MSQTTRSHTPIGATNGQRHPPRFPSLLLALVLFLGAVGAAPPAGAQSSCTEAGKNTECNQFGYIAMKNQYDIRGKAVKVPIDIQLESTFRDYESNWVMISVRNVTEDLSNPVMIRFESLETPHGKVEAEKVEQPSANELAIWMHVLDTPVGIPMRLETTIGSSDQGAYRLEVLVMVFDRAYEPIVGPSGKEVALYTFSLLGVNDVTAKVQDSTSAQSRLRALPAPGFVLVGLALVGLAAVLTRRGRA